MSVLVHLEGLFVVDVVLEVAIVPQVLERGAESIVCIARGIVQLGGVVDVDLARRLLGEFDENDGALVDDSLHD